MKKTMSLILALVLSFSIVIANADSNPEGLWIVYSDTLTMLLKLNSDKTCSWIWITFLAGNASTGEVSGTWKAKGSKITVSTEEGKIDMGKTKNGQSIGLVIDAQTMEYSISGDKLNAVSSPLEYTRVPKSSR